MHGKGVWNDLWSSYIVEDYEALTGMLTWKEGRCSSIQTRSNNYSTFVQFLLTISQISPLETFNNTVKILNLPDFYLAKAWGVRSLSLETFSSCWRVCFSYVPRFVWIGILPFRIICFRSSDKTGQYTQKNEMKSKRLDDRHPFVKCLNKPPVR